MIERLNRTILSVNFYYPGDIFCIIKVVAMSNDLRRMIRMKNQGRVALVPARFCIWVCIILIFQ